MKVEWPTVVLVAILCAFVAVMYKLGVVSGTGFATSVLTAVVGALGKPMLADKMTGGASIIPPAMDVPPVSIPTNDAPKVDP